MKNFPSKIFLERKTPLGEFYIDPKQVGNGRLLNVLAKTERRVWKCFIEKIPFGEYSNPVVAYLEMTEKENNIMKEHGFETIEYGMWRFKELTLVEKSVDLSDGVMRRFFELLPDYSNGNFNSPLEAILKLGKPHFNELPPQLRDSMICD